MRQAYDYWQNQPGNYLDPAVAPKHGHRRRPGGRPELLRWLGPAVRPNARRAATPAVSRRRRQPAIQLPPLNSPRSGPPQGNAGPARATCRLRHAHLEWRISATHHAPGDGYRLRLTPECLEDNGGQRPVIHRLLQRPRVETFGTSVARHPPNACVPRGPTRIRCQTNVRSSPRPETSG